MVTATSTTMIKLNLSANSTLPTQCSCHIEQGYVRMASLTEAGEYVSLGLWGPGELLIPTSLGGAHQEWLALSDARVCQREPTTDEYKEFVLDQLRQTSSLLVIQRVRPIEDRLLQLLIWLGEKFGRINSMGMSLSTNDLNLTHRSLAELAGTTRVTVTKTLTRFRLEGQLLSNENNDLLIPFTSFWSHS